MKDSVKKMIAAAGFAVLAIIIILGLNILMKPKWSTEYSSGTNIRGFYEMPRNSVDVLVLGSSNVICGVNSNYMLSEAGISAYTCGTESQPLFGSYAWLCEAMRFHKLSAVVLDVGDLWDKFDEASYRKALDYMHLSSLKLRLLGEYKSINPDADIASYILPLIMYHSRFDELTSEDIMYSKDALKGFFIRPEQRNKEFIGISDPGNEGIKNIPAEHLEYFLKIIDKCKENNIPLLLICGPSIKAKADEHNAVQKIADENGLIFLDFNETGKWPEIDYAADMADFQHFNTNGADKATQRIIDELKQLCELPDRSCDRLQEKLGTAYVNAYNNAFSET